MRTENPIDLARLAEPFPATDIEWRVQRCGVKNGRVWARVVAYVTNRAIMERLDRVAGPGNWKNRYRAGPAGGVLCGISIRTSSEWVTKYDGSENTDIESVKGGLSAAMKRAAVQWGIGRYLYGLEDGWASVHDDGRYQGETKDGTRFRWDPPELPAWALSVAPAPPKNAPGFAKSAAEAENNPMIIRGEDRPARATGGGAVPATTRQVEMLERLAGRVMLDAGELAKLMTALPTLTKPVASTWIDRLRALPERRMTNGADVLVERLTRDPTGNA